MYSGGDSVSTRNGESGVVIEPLHGLSGEAFEIEDEIERVYSVLMEGGEVRHFRESVLRAS
jgi:hypothetical protein